MSHLFFEHALTPDGWRRDVRVVNTDSVESTNHSGAEVSHDRIAPGHGHAGRESYEYLAGHVRRSRGRWLLTGGRNVGDR